VEVDKARKLEGLALAEHLAAVDAYVAARAAAFERGATPYASSRVQGGIILTPEPDVYSARVKLNVTAIALGQARAATRKALEGQRGQAANP
jgi:hypothetical protein